jgi:hypothetical protein
MIKAIRERSLKSQILQPTKPFMPFTSFENVPGGLSPTKSQLLLKDSKEENGSN